MLHYIAAVISATFTLKQGVRNDEFSSLGKSVVRSDQHTCDLLVVIFTPCASVLNVEAQPCTTYWMLNWPILTWATLFAPQSIQACAA